MFFEYLFNSFTNEPKPALELSIPIREVTSSSLLDDGCALSYSVSAWFLAASARMSDNLPRPCSS